MLASPLSTFSARVSSPSQEYHSKNGEPLFSSHMLDLSEEPIHENLDICKKYLTRMKKVCRCGGGMRSRMCGRYEFEGLNTGDRGDVSPPACPRTCSHST